MVSKVSLPLLALAVVLGLVDGALYLNARPELTQPLIAAWSALLRPPVASPEVASGPSAEALLQDDLAEATLASLTFAQSEFRLRRGYYSARLAPLLPFVSQGPLSQGSLSPGPLSPDVRLVVVNAASYSYCMRAEALLGSGRVFYAAPSSGVGTTPCSPVRVF